MGALVEEFDAARLAELGRFVLFLEVQPPALRSDLRVAAAQVIAEFLAANAASGSTGETGS